MGEFCYGRAYFGGTPESINTAALAYTCLISAGLRATRQQSLEGKGYPAWDIFKDTLEVRELKAKQLVFVESFEFTPFSISLDLRCENNLGDLYLQKVCTSYHLDCRWVYTRPQDYSSNIKSYSCTALGQSGLELASFDEEIRRYEERVAGGAPRHRNAGNVKRMHLDSNETPH